MSKYNKLDKSNGKPRVAFYTRISTDEDHQKYSLGAQKERLEAFCKAQYGDEWVLHKLYRDTESGTHMNRPGLEEMLYDAENRSFDILMVFRVDRLSRKVRELAQMVDELTKHNIALKSITEPFDTTNAAGKMMLQMLGVFAEFEHTTIVERTKVGLERKARTGRFVGGYVPYGYTLDPEKGLVVNEEEAALVKKMFKMYAFGKQGTWAISDHLNRAGYRKRSGRKWDKRVILHILKNPVYIGKLRWREVLYDGNHEPLISEVLFDKAREVLDKRNEELKGRQFKNGDERLLSGIMRCAKCGSHMFGGGGKKNGRYIPYYMCSRRWTQHECDQDYVRADLLEESIIEDVKSIFRDEQLIARIWKKAKGMLATEKPDIEKEIRVLEDRVIKAQARIDKYFEAFEEGKLKPEVCSEKVEDLNLQLRELEAEKKELEARRKRLELPALDKEMLEKIVDSLEKVMAEGDNKKRKHLLNLLVKKVLIHNRRTVEVWYAIPNCKPDRRRFETWDIWLPGLDTKLCIKTVTIQLLVRMYKYRTRRVRIVFGEPLPEEKPLPKPVPKNIIAEALKVKAFFSEDPERNFRHASQHFKVSKARISQLMKIVYVLPEDFVAYMEHCQDETIIRRFSGKTLLRIAGLESPKQRQEAISELMEEVEVCEVR